MGYLNNEHIKKFMIGQTIAKITDHLNSTYIHFESGEILQLSPYEEGRNHTCSLGCTHRVYSPTIIATPKRKDGEVIQSTETVKRTKHSNHLLNITGALK